MLLLWAAVQEDVNKRASRVGFIDGVSLQGGCRDELWSPRALENPSNPDLCGARPFSLPCRAQASPE